MIDYETFCRILHLHERERLTVAQIARAVSLDPRTVRTWIESGRFRPRRSSPRSSKLDPHKRYIQQLLEAHPYSAVQIHQRLKEAGFEGGITTVRDYVRAARPRRAPAFLTLAFAPGE